MGVGNVIPMRLRYYSMERWLRAFLSSILNHIIIRKARLHNLEEQKGNFQASTPCLLAHPFIPHAQMHYRADLSNG